MTGWQNSLLRRARTGLVTLGLLLPALSGAQQVNPILGYSSAAAENYHVLSFSNFWGGSVTTSASSGYILIFDATAVPATGAVTPKLCYQIQQAGTTGIITPGNVPIHFNNGVVVAFSTGGNCWTYTNGTNAFFFVEGQ